MDTRKETLPYAWSDERREGLRFAAQGDGPIPGLAGEINEWGHRLPVQEESNVAIVYLERQLCLGHHVLARSTNHCARGRRSLGTPPRRPRRANVPDLDAALWRFEQAPNCILEIVASRRLANPSAASPGDPGSYLLILVAYLGAPGKEDLARIRGKDALDPRRGVAIIMVSSLPEAESALRAA